MERMKIEDNDGINEIYLKVTIQDLEEENKELYNKLMGVCDRVYELEEENKKLKERIKELENELEYVRTIKDSAEGTLKEVRVENKKLKDDVDFFYKSAKQFREDAESWRKECERLLGLQLCGKTIAERIEDDKKAKNIFIDKNGKVVSGGEFRELC